MYLNYLSSIIPYDGIISLTFQPSFLVISLHSRIVSKKNIIRKTGGRKPN